MNKGLQKLQSEFTLACNGAEIQQIQLLIEPLHYKHGACTKKEGKTQQSWGTNIFQSEFMYKNSGLVSFSFMHLPPASL